MINSTRVRDLNNGQQGLKGHRSGLDREFKNGWNVGGKAGKSLAGLDIPQWGSLGLL